MRVTPISSPLPGEHLASTFPAMRPETFDAGWRLRLDFWSGRSLTADALELEQDNRAAQLAWRGRLATPGIVAGLEVVLESAAEPDATLTRTGYFVHVLPGHGFRADGEDIVIPRPLRVPLHNIPVEYVRIGGPNREASTEPIPAGATGGPPVDAGGFVFNVDRFGADHEPWAAVLVLAPAEFRTFERVDPEDPCELDLSADAFADERRIDASMLRLVELPVAWESFPQLADRDDLRWRNRLADVVFTQEAVVSARQQIRFREAEPAGQRWDTVLRSSDLFPWDLLGVPLALLSSERASAAATARTYFLDRATMVRPGGRARTRTRPALRLATTENEAALNPPGAGQPLVWRARVDQFAEHVGLFESATPDQIAELASRFQFVPAAGFLPRSALDFLTTQQALALPQLPNQPPDRAGVNYFFPSSFAVEAVPVAIEDLDAALAASAALERYDFSVTGQPCRVLVPVPQRAFDPRLLVVELEDPIFARTVARFVAVRQDWRQRRDFVRDQLDTLRAVTNGPFPPAVVPALESGQLEPEPTEVASGLGFSEALLSPAGTRPPWEAHVAFGAARTVAPATQLCLVLRLDIDGPPGRVDVRWQTDAGTELAHSWAEPPNPPPETTDAAGQPLATPLWLRFPVTGQQLGVTASASLTGLTLHIDDGRIGLAAAGEITANGEELFWRVEDDETAPAPQFTGGDWTRISGSRLLAPFEAEYTPVFPDGRTLAARLAEVDSALNPSGVTARSVAMSVATHGLEKVLAELEAEASQADDFVDAHFTRAQTNLYRIRKLILGENAAQKLLINPAIATIAEQETATASATQLNTFLTAAKSRTAPFAAVNTAMGATAPAAPTSSGSGSTFTLSMSAIEGFTELAQPNLFFSAALPLTRAIITEPIDTVTRIGTRTVALGDVFGERPESGPTLPPRGLSIGQRFTEPRATQNLSYARSSLTNFLTQLPRLRLPLVGQSVRSLDGANNVPLIELQGRAVPPAGSASTSESIRQTAISRLMNVPALTADTDEAEVTLAALDFTETQSAILRLIEKVGQDRRAIVSTGVETLSLTAVQRDEAAARVLGIEGKLAEARHDVSVARALRQEEQQRVAEVNRRRDAIVANEVRFLAYVRPRTVDPGRRQLTYWQLEPFGVAAPVPACLQRHDEPAPPLNAYIQLFRHAPARWFTAIPPLMAKLDTPDKLVALLDTARASALSFATVDAAGAVRGSAEAVQFTVLGAHRVIGALRQRTQLMDIADTRIRRWTDFQRDALEHATIGDLIAGRHGARAVSAAAAEELERIGAVATCLHAELAASPPAMRLAWIERFSQFDRPGLLRDLTILPQFARLDRQVRRRLQELADWLFGRVNTTDRDAVNVINDLVRLCLLLASHAPVNRIIAGHIPRPTPVRPGIHIPIRPLNPELVRVGMEFHVWRESQIVAGGRVADLQVGEVSARVETVAAQTTTLDATMRVQFVAEALSFRR